MPIELQIRAGGQEIESWVDGTKNKMAWRTDMGCARGCAGGVRGCAQRFGANLPFGQNSEFSGARKNGSARVCVFIYILDTEWYS